MQNACFFIGHRPEKLPWGRDTASPAFRCFYVRLAEAMEHAAASGFREFYTGMTEGVSLWAGEIVAGYKAAHPADGVRLVAVRPYQGQGRFRDPESRRLYGEVLAAADEAVVLSSTYTRHCMADANRYMLARCGLLIAGYDGHTPGGTANTVALAARQGRTVWRVAPSRPAPSGGASPCRFGRGRGRLTIPRREAIVKDAAVPRTAAGQFATILTGQGSFRRSGLPRPGAAKPCQNKTREGRST